MTTVKLGEICDFLNGGAWSDKEYVLTGLPVLKVTNCKPSGFALSDIDYLPYSAAEKYAKNKLELGDVIIATVGSHPNLKDSAAGRSCVVNSMVEGYYLNQNAVCMRTKDSDVLDQGYLGYLSKYYEFQHFIQMRGRGAANQMRIAISSIKEYNCKLPNIEIQRRIASILSAYDDLIENNQKQIKLLEEAAQRLYKEWFVDLHFPGYENVKVVDGVPEGWEKKTILDMSSVLRRGISPKYNDKGKYTVINQKCIRQTIMDIKESRQQEKEYPADMNLKDSDIVICSTGSGTLGRVGQVFGDYPDTTFDSHVTLVRAKKPDHSQFLFLTLKYLQPLLMTLGQGSTNQLELPKRVIESYGIICPTEKLIIDFESAILPIHNKITSLVSIIKNATEARDRLLPKLMSGEVEV
ncbi:restriction endonuclease subunit S [Ruminococcus flavefaciens]|uniref:Type I restriction enzyme, S subunit n=1 Tax=Ruminococcus flavefaciens TaxID=1265 RepID=A0A1K1MFG6_RUMFL|nr:restriction endonuclease subunit S [Ruminococcus flavefaciens]SFW21898.1 type I restriction enzyme, S subunit [Ruminococcus flavefaciens]